MKSNGSLGFALLGACLLVSAASLVTGCGGDDDSDDGDGGSSGSGRFGCLIGEDGDACLEYYGSSANVDRIREESDCEGQGGTEVDACPTEGAAICKLPASGSVGSSQFYYGLDEDDIEANRLICEEFNGTFTAP